MARIKKVVEYKLWLNNNSNKITPPHITDGGYYLKDDGTMVGILDVDDDVYIPEDAFKELSDADLKDRIIILRSNEESLLPHVDMLERLTVDEEVTQFMNKLL